MKCKLELPLDAFLDSSNGRGLYGKRSQCRKCQAEYKRQLRANAKKDGTKICTVCGEEKPRTEFYRGTNKEGRMRLCKDCQQQKMSNYAKEHRKEINIKNKKRYHTDINYRQRRKISTAKWDKNNREKINRTVRTWHVKNPHKRSEYHARYRTRKAENGGNHTANEFEILCKEYDYRCLCCGSDNKLTEDHIVPIAKGGTNDISNLQPLCMSCNASKQDKIIDYRR